MVGSFFDETLSLTKDFFVALKATSFVMLVILSKIDFKNLYQSKFFKQLKVIELVLSTVVDNSLHFLLLGEVLNNVLMNERKSYSVKLWKKGETNEN